MAKHLVKLMSSSRKSQCSQNRIPVTCSPNCLDSHGLKHLDCQALARFIALTVRSRAMGYVT